MILYRFLLLSFVSLVALLSCAPDKPKNIIIMISDGCGFNHMHAASYFEYGKTGQQIYENFPVSYAMQTYSLDANNYNPDSAWTSAAYVKRKPTDSAAAATAMATGVKTINTRIGVDSLFLPVENILERVETYGKSTGLVTSVQLSHVTPAGFGAHNEYRRNYKEIANQMLHESGLEVLMGGGHPGFDKDGLATMDSSYKFVGGRETWNALLNGAVGGDCDNDGFPDIWSLIQTKQEFQNLMSGNTPKRVVGVAQVKETLQEDRSGDKQAKPYADPFNAPMPTLSEMTLGALNVLDNNPNGFLVMIEGGAVDWAGHDNSLGRMVEEQVAFNQTVSTVVNWIEKSSNWNETLLIVTADHETGFLSGPDSDISSSVKEKIWKPLVNKGKGIMPGMQWNHTKHTNTLVPFFAKGIASDRFSRYVVGMDPVRGAYIDNCSIAKLVFSMFKNIK